MLINSLTLVFGLLLPAGAETILGVTVFTRHGDRSSKHYKGYGLTNLGFQQNFKVGSSYRALYLSPNSSKAILGIRENDYKEADIFASAPDQTVLLNTAQAFLQGLYPPNAKLAAQRLNDGTEVASPLDGYQYVVLHGEEADAPDTIWLKGDESCPAATTSIAHFAESAEFQQRSKTTSAFYQSFWDNALENVPGYQRANMTYKNAYDIFDLLNTASIHSNLSQTPEEPSTTTTPYIRRNVTADELFHLRVLADSAEFGEAFNASETANARAMGGRTFAGAVLRQLNATVAADAASYVKFSLLAGSYDTFLAFFGLAGLTAVDGDFYGLPDYASTMSFEVFSHEDVEARPAAADLRVRFLFRNGSDEGAVLRAWPLFGAEGDSMPYTEFVAQMEGIAVTGPQEWCAACNSTALFCDAYQYSAEAVAGGGSGKKGVSNVVAGVIGAMVTLGVVAVLGAGAVLVVRKRRARRATLVVVPPMKQSFSDGGSA